MRNILKPTRLSVYWNKFSWLIFLLQIIIFYLQMIKLITHISIVYFSEFYLFTFQNSSVLFCLPFIHTTYITQSSVKFLNGAYHLKQWFTEKIIGLRKWRSEEWFYYNKTFFHFLNTSIITMVNSEEYSIWILSFSLWLQFLETSAALPKVTNVML